MAPGDHEPGSLAPADAATAAIRASEPAYVEGALHWLQSEPGGSGRTVLMRATPDGPRACSPKTSSIRSRLFGYGAGSWCATLDGLVGVDAATQGLALLAPDGTEPRGPAGEPGDAIGDPVLIPSTSWVVVAAAHPGPAGALHGLAAVDVARGARVSLLDVVGRCAEPQVAPDGRTIAWLEWPAGSMPWDAAELWVASIEVAADAVSCSGARRLDGGRGCSAGQPTWLADGSLAYVTEAAGWWQPWLCDDGGAVRRLCDRRAEFQRPRWLTCRWLAPLGIGDALGCAFADADGEHVGVLDAGGLDVLDQPCVRVDGVAAHDGTIAWVGATVAMQGVVCAADRGGAVELVSAGPVAHDAPAPRRFTLTYDGVTLDGVCWAPEREGPSPLVVTVHPGPTGAVDRGYAPVVHLLTSRGFAVASLDHSGSTAHGRAHRERLLGRYGELDVAECLAAVAHLIAAGIADPARCFVRGTSAGGTTALLALAGGTVRGAVAWYPASRFDDDADADGFEAGYLAALVGPDGAGRAPIERGAALRGSALVIQGEDDEVIDPAETAALVAALRAGLDDVEELVVPGEGHGFRTAAGRAVALEAELAFYLRHAVAARPHADRYDPEASGPSAPGARP